MKFFYLRVLIAVSLASLAISLSPNLANAAAVTFTDGNGITYSADDSNIAGGASVTGYSGSSRSPVIPSIVNIGGTSYNVTKIGDSAFHYSIITGITLPNTLTRIGDLSFDNSHLHSVVIPDGVTYVGDHSFSNEDDLTSVSFGSGVQTIKYAAFANVPGLTSIDIPASVQLIEEYAFGYSPQITSVTFEGSVSNIAQRAFFSNENRLTSIIFNGAPPGTMGSSALGNGVQSVTFRIPYLAANYSGGFTFPQWNGFNTHSIAMVMFDANGGSAMSPPGVSSALAGRILTPASPTKTGFTFAGWYPDLSSGPAWNFATDTVTNSITLHAKWVTGSPSDSRGTGGSTNNLASTGSNSVPLVWIGFAAIAIGFIATRFKPLNK